MSQIQNYKIRYKKVRKVKLPKYDSEIGNAIDFFIPDDILLINNGIIKPQEIIKIPLGICLEMPRDFYCVLLNRSSLGLKGLDSKCPLIDWSYRGEIHAVLQNITPYNIQIKNGDKIIQGLINKQSEFIIEESDEIYENTSRGNKNFGSTNDKP